MHLFANITGNQAIRLQVGTIFHINALLDGIAADPSCLKDNNSIHLFKCSFNQSLKVGEEALYPLQ